MAAVAPALTLAHCAQVPADEDARPPGGRRGAFVVSADDGTTGLPPDAHTVALPPN
jgi:hypothetical protein